MFENLYAANANTSKAPVFIQHEADLNYREARAGKIIYKAESKRCGLSLAPTDLFVHGLQFTVDIAKYNWKPYVTKRFH